MRAEEKLMVGVGAIGLFALGWMILGPTSAKAEPPTPPAPPLPPPVPRPVVPLPDVLPRPPTPPPTPQGLAYLGSPATLESGRKYQAIVQLSEFEASVPFIDKRKAIADKFQALGFSDVKVYENFQQLPIAWPTETLANLADTDRLYYAEGVWARPTASGIPLPPQVLKGWKAP